MLEIQSPAGSLEAVVANVQSGADAIYLGFDSADARKGSGSFSMKDMENALRYCRTRGCKVYITMNALLSDSELPEAAALVHRAAQAGADAFLLQDPGMARIVRAVAPQAPIHASAKMGFHNLEGLRAARELGFSRVMLPRELTYDQICRLAAESPVELGVTVHGFLCAGFSGQCYLGSFTDGCGGNRGHCARPCARQYSTGSRMDNYPLSLKDLCLIEHLSELEAAGVASIKIRGRNNRPEYAASVTALYVSAAREKRMPSPEELQKLQRAFSPGGFTDACFTGKNREAMFGVSEQEQGREIRRYISGIKKGYADRELRRVPIRVYAMLRLGETSKFVAEDDAGRKAAFEGPVPAAGGTTTIEGLRSVFYKTTGTPYTCTDVAATVEAGAHLTVQQLTDVRNALLRQLTAMRKIPPEADAGAFPPAPVNKTQLGTPKAIFQISSAEQLTPELAQLAPDYLYVPLELLVSEYEKIFPFVQCGTVPVAVMPRVIRDEERRSVAGLLERAKMLGVRETLVNNLGHVALARSMGFEIRGDYGLNAFNSYTLGLLHEAGCLSATASFELRLRQIRDLIKPLNTELIVYGRLPVMLTDLCIVKHSAGKCTCANTQFTLSDKFGAVYPVMREFGCRNMIYHSNRLYLADKLGDVSKCGLWGWRLLFTTESPRECLTIARHYQTASGRRPNGYTRGVYYKGVQ